MHKFIIPTSVKVKLAVLSCTKSQVVVGPPYPSISLPPPVGAHRSSSMYSGSHIHMGLAILTFPNSIISTTVRDAKKSKPSIVKTFVLFSTVHVHPDWQSTIHAGTFKEDAQQHTFNTSKRINIKSCAHSLVSVNLHLNSLTGSVLAFIKVATSLYDECIV